MLEKKSLEKLVKLVSKIKFIFLYEKEGKKNLFTKKEKIS